MPLTLPFAAAAIIYFFLLLFIYYIADLLPPHAAFAAAGRCRLPPSPLLLPQAAFAVIAV